MHVKGDASYLAYAKIVLTYRMGVRGRQLK